MSSTNSSTDSNKSVTSAMPQWMRTKLNDRYNLDQAGSPPEDDYFNMKYPKSTQAELISDAAPMRKTSTTEAYQKPEIDASAMKRSATASGNLCNQFKNMSVDEGYKSENEGFGHSIVAAAQNILSGKIWGGGSTQTAEEAAAAAQYNRQRRDSQSLPTSRRNSPTSSPKIGRRNPYFTAPFARSTENLDQPGWLLLSLLNSQRISMAELTESPDEVSNVKPKKRLMDVDPAEMREMNFWSPTSM